MTIITYAFYWTVLLTAMTRNTQNINGRRRQKNVVSIAYNLLAWCLDVLGDMLGVWVMTWDFHLAMNLYILCSSGLTPQLLEVGCGVVHERQPRVRVPHSLFYLTIDFGLGRLSVFES